jgi:hypothetical protein
MAAPKPTSPGVYTYEKDLSLRGGNNSLGSDEESLKIKEPTNSNPTVKPTFWVLECGIWDDEGSWLSYAKWEDSPIC